jgi:hypothetical protein
MTVGVTTAISRYPVPDLVDLPEGVRARILSVQEKSGFVPNVFLALAISTGRVSRIPPITTR